MGTQFFGMDNSSDEAQSAVDLDWATGGYAVAHQEAESAPEADSDWETGGYAAAHLEEENGRLRRQVAALQEENELLRQENEHLRAKFAKLVDNRISRT